MTTHHDGLDLSNVTAWEGRPKRTRKPPPTTYWEEFVATDEWYLQKLVEDIPPDEMYAALDDEQLDDAGEEGDSELESCGEDMDFDDVDDDIPSESEESDGAESETDTSTPGTPHSAQVYRTPERQ